MNKAKLAAFKTLDLLLDCLGRAAGFPDLDQSFVTVTYLGHTTCGEGAVLFLWLVCLQQTR